MSVTRKVLDLACHDTSATVHARLHSLADDVAELERERDAYRAQVAQMRELSLNYRTRAKYAPEPPAQWAAVEADLNRILGGVS